MAERPANAAAPRRHRLALALVASTLLVLAWGGALAAALWFDLDAPARAPLAALLRPRAGIVLLFVLLLPLLLWPVLRRWARAWPQAAARLREEVAIVATAHAGHRVAAPPGAASQLRELAAALDQLALAHAALRTDVERQVAESQRRLGEETRRLAAVTSELPQGVVVCNRDGRVLLYNARAAQMLAGAGAEAAASFGLGRPLAGVLDGAALDHAWQQVQRRLAQGTDSPVARFVTSRPGAAPADRGQLLRGQMVPVPAEPPAASAGWVLILEDVTRSVHDQARREALLQRLTEGSRAALANLRAAAQALQQYPAMDAAQRSRFTAVVHDEAERLAQQLDQALSEPGHERSLAWPREDVRLGDLALALQQGLRAAEGIDCRFDGSGAARWLEVDSHALVQLLGALAGRLAAAFGLRQLTLQVHEAARLVRLDLVWPGPALAATQLQAWESALIAPGGGRATRVREVLDRHGAELWTLGDGDTQRLCLQLPAMPDADDGQRAAAPGRPVSYDFDLFHQAGQSAALDDTPLARLSYTVFDCETTGLRPSEGDEIIAIGACRILNQRLLEHERFDRLCRPRRAVRASAQAVHGISMAQLEGQPALEQVLPDFAAFAADTVLVAHNAAFDMRFLELARERCGVRFDQPVLDTLLLSGVVHPGHGSNEHHLEQIAARLGVPVAARHQALGDATVAAGVFLKLLPLLAERGIVTLGQAREASMRTVHAREAF